MTKPDVIAKISSNFLTRGVHSGLYSLDAYGFSQYPCPNETSDYTYTSIDVFEVIPLRGDDSTFANNLPWNSYYDLKMFFGDLQAHVDPAIPDYIAFDPITITSSAGSATILTTPKIFLLVSLTVDVFKQRIGWGFEDALADLKAWGFTGFARVDDPVHFAPLVFHVRQPDENGAVFADFEGVYNREIFSIPAAIEAIKALRNPVGGLRNIPLPLPISSFVAGLPISRLVNAAIVTQPWPTNQRAADAGPGGLVLGFDIAAPGDEGEWRSFLSADSPSSGAAWDLTPLDWEFRIGDDALRTIAIDTANEKVALYLPDWLEFRITTVDWDGATLTIEGDAYDKWNHVSLGSATVTVVFSLSDQSLVTTTCVSASQSAFLQFLEVFVGVVIGLIAGGIPGAILGGAIAGFIAGVGNEIVQAFSADAVAAHLDTNCTYLGNGCTSCISSIGRDIPFVGSIHVRDFVTLPEGIVMKGSLFAGATLPRLPELWISTTPWGHPWGPCHPPSVNPSMTLQITNTGELPLQVCHIAAVDINPPPQGWPHPTKTEVVQHIPDSIPTLQQGQSVTLVLTADAFETPRYNPNGPLPIEIVSSGGVVAIDLNSAIGSHPRVPATALDAETLVRETLFAEATCAHQQTTGHGVGGIVPGHGQPVVDPLRPNEEPQRGQPILGNLAVRIGTHVY